MNLQLKISILRVVVKSSAGTRKILEYDYVLFNGTSPTMAKVLARHGRFGTRRGLAVGRMAFE